MSRTPKVRTWPKIREGMTRGGAYFCEVDSGSKLENRVRQRFENREQAEDLAQELRARLKREGESAFALTPTEREDARAALRELEGTGGTLLDAAKHYRHHNRPVGGDKSVDEVIAELIEFKTVRQKARPRYVGDLKSKLERFSKTFGGRPVTEVSSAEIDMWLYGDTTIGELTRENYFRALTVLFNFAKGRRDKRRTFTADPYRADNPMDKVSRPAVEEITPQILSVAQARQLLEAAAKTDEKRGMLGFIALGLFTGLRTSELSQLGWEHVRIDGDDSIVTVPGTIAKKRRIRNVPIPKAARAWLARAWRNPSGAIAPRDAERKLSAVAAVAGITPWPANAMRHSFGSYAFAETDDSAKVSSWLGHRGDRMLFDHYRALATKKDGERFFKIMPKANRKKIVKFSTGAA